MSLRFEWRQSQVLYPSLAQGRTIRLLTVLPGLYYERVVCLLHETELEAAPQGYKALSYAWSNGSDPSDQSILCNDTPILISANLESALRRLRGRREPLVLWVDSLCINQKDNVERTYQVSMMRDIYQRADEVVIWLGESGPDDDLGEWLLPLLTGSGGGGQDESSLFEWHGDHRDMPKLRAYFSEAANALRPNVSEDTAHVFGAFFVLHALKNGLQASEIHQLRHVGHALPILRGFNLLMRQKWWERVWCVQEVVVGAKATLHYGKISASWTMFSRAALQYEKSRLTTNLDSVYPYLDGQPLMHFSRVISEIESTRRDWGDIEPIGLLPLLRKFRSRFASDQRDKVFALLGLVRFWGRRQLKILPDYGLDTIRVFLGTTRTLLASVESLSVLAGTLQREVSEQSGIPSWVIDWNCPPEVNEHVRLGNVPMYNAGGATGRVRIHGHSLLEVQGCYVDQVAHTGDELLGTSIARMRQVVAGWESSWNLMSKLKRGDDEVSEEDTVSDAFWRTLCGDLEYVRKPARDADVVLTAGASETAKDGFRRTTPGDSSVYEQWRSADRASKRRASIIAGFWQESSASDSDAEKKSAFNYAVECASGGRKFFITRKGYIGTGPRNMLEGDEVCVLLGSQVPFILRRSAHSRLCRASTLEDLITTDRSDRTYFEAGKEAVGKAPGVSTGATCNLVHDNCYCVVGDAYVHGIMDGEVLEGVGGVRKGSGAICLI